MPGNYIIFQHGLPTHATGGVQAAAAALHPTDHEQVAESSSGIRCRPSVPNPNPTRYDTNEHTSTREPEIMGIGVLVGIAVGEVEVVGCLLGSWLKSTAASYE